jgi:electron transport complex protein RnfG
MIKRDFIIPLIVLAGICLIISGALAATNRVTSPVIAEAAAGREKQAQKLILPDVDEFIPLEVYGLPRSVTRVYGTSNGEGFIFMITVNGYGGEMRLICGIGPDGRIIKAMTLSEKETRGIATPVFAQEPLYIGKDRALEGIDAVSGATITFNAYRNGILDAFKAYDLIMEGRK